MNFEIVQGSFSGPMEVLLDLIKKREMDIYDIQIHILVDDFLAYIDSMEGPIMDIVVDFLAMASYLLAIKSRMLLPKPIPCDEEEEEDPRDDLVEKIIEYQRIKACSELLEKMAEYEEGAVYKRQEDFSEFSEEELIADGEIKAIAAAFCQVMRQFYIHEEAKKSLEKISASEYSFQQAGEKIQAAFKRWEKPYFLEMIRDAKSRIEIVTVFLMLLELIKLQKITCQQDGKDIVLVKKEEVYAF